MTARLKYEGQDLDGWIRVCENRTGTGGFYPDDEDGKDVQPTADLWTSNQDRCDSCGRVLDQSTCEVDSMLDASSVLSRRTATC